jgi:predicted RNA-binding Zn-ribbon protein involved in translation (DUF1610 family)
MGRDARRRRMAEAVALVLTLAAISAAFSSGPTVLVLGAAVAAVGVAAISGIMLRRKSQRLIALVHANAFEHCLHCGYQLTGLPASHRCPECGADYELDDVREKWRMYLAELARNDPYVLHSLRRNLRA